MAKAFDRMLFLTATPFQLGHHELTRVLERFADVRWDANELGSPDSYHQQLSDLGKHLNESQRTAIALQRSWSRLRPEDCDGDLESWWTRLVQSSRESLNNHQRSVVDDYDAAKRSRDIAEKALRPWVVRHNKGAHWDGTDVTRRQRIDGAAVAGHTVSGGLPIPPPQLLPFFLAARSAVKPGQDLLGEALSSSYEAFRFTRQNRDPAKDEQEKLPKAAADLSHARWYLREFDRALEHTSGSTHPKVYATVRKVVDLWEAGEKVLVFAFYRYTCRALRIHISQEIEQRMMTSAQKRLAEGGRDLDKAALEQLLEGIQKRFFDDPKTRGRRALDRRLGEIMRAHAKALDKVQFSQDQRDALADVMRRFLRVSTTLIRCFPLVELERIKPAQAVDRALAHADGSGTSWRQKFDGVIGFLVECSAEERRLYLEAARRTQTGGIRVEDEEDEDEGPGASAATVTLANVQVATGRTKCDRRARLMRSFNTPFFPDILVCSEVMGEGVDLQRFCRHVIHHDLAWNPSTIEHRTGRIDRLGCKAEGRQPIVVYLPYLAGTADERQYQVMSEREQWFRVVMGQDEVAGLITPDSSGAIALPETISKELAFKLGLQASTPLSGVPHVETGV